MYLHHEPGEIKPLLDQIDKEMFKNTFLELKKIKKNRKYDTYFLQYMNINDSFFSLFYIDYYMTTKNLEMAYHQSLDIINQL